MSQSKIYVGNLSYSSAESDLNEYFAQFGAISEIKLITDRETGRSKGFAFISFDEAADAEKAISEANGAELQGRQIKVNMARDDQRRSGGGGRGGRGGAPR